MAEIQSPLYKSCVAGRYGASGSAGVMLGTRQLRGLWQLAGWDGFEVAAIRALKPLGFSTLGTYRSAQKTEFATIWRIAPDKLLIEAAEQFARHNSPELTVLDLSHARTAITLSGPAARDLMAQLVAVDLSNAAFQPGEFIQTGIHHVGVLVNCTNESGFDILVPSTWAEAVWEITLENALPYGAEIVSDG